MDSCEVQKQKAGPGAGLYSLDSVAAVMVRAWEELMYQPQVLVKAASPKLDDNRDRVLNAQEFHNLVHLQTLHF